MKRLVLVGIVVVVALLVWVGLQYMEGGQETANPRANEVTENSGDLEITKIDSTRSGSRVPAGFPSNIPLETIGITNAIKAEGAGEITYTVNYLSSKPKDDIWTVYSDFMLGNGYNIDRQVSSKSLGQIRGTKGAATLTVLASTRNNQTQVYVSYNEKL